MSDITKYKRQIKKINSLEEEYKKLADKDFQAKTALFKMRLKSGETVDKMMVEVYALAREAARRVTNMWAYEVQLIGAMGANDGRIVEMKTGEGKTLTIIFPAYLNSLEGQGVHVVTANDYLAQRDAQKMKPIYDLLGVSVNYITSQTSDFDRQVAYAADITYVTNNEIGFDFLKDNMLYDPASKRQRELHYAIVDEADSVLIDEAQMPLVIADRLETSEQEKVIYQKINGLINQLKKKLDFKVDEKEHVVTLTVNGIAKLEKLLNVKNLYEEEETDYIFYVEQLLKAYHLFEKDKDYIVDEGKVVIVDEFTGRLMESHRFFQGIHQALEAKENLTINDESKTLAAITFQHLFKRYKKMAGLTGTAQTAEKEFRLIYGKKIVAVPTNRPIARQDLPDKFFLNWQDKLRYVTWNTKEHYYQKRATLIGTRSVHHSNQVHTSLLAENVVSNVLNAKHTQREAEVVSGAGQPQTVTVATNMAGRGTDIELADSVKEKGGLVILGTARHNAQRIDRQLMGRSGRQGDPGQSQFLIDADDELIKTHFKEKYIFELKKHENWAEGIESKKMDQIVQKAQKRMENLFFEQRVLSYEFDKVLESQRNSFYRQRNRVLLDEDLKEETLSLVRKQVYKTVLSNSVQNRRKKFLTDQELAKVSTELQKMAISQWFKIPFKKGDKLEFKTVYESGYKAYEEFYNMIEQHIGAEKMRNVEKTVTLKVLDLIWVEFLKRADQLQEAAVVASISQPNFYDNYKVKMGATYQNILFSVPKVVCLTLFRTLNRMVSEGNIKPQQA